jgi:hypothetical protein
VFEGRASASVLDAQVLDPESFQPGSLLRNRAYWADVVIEKDDKLRDYALKMLGDIEVEDVFHGKDFVSYRGQDHFNTILPPPAEFANYGLDQLVKGGETGERWLASWAKKRLTKGLIRRWKSSPLDVADRPVVVNAMTVEPSKPRAITAMCYPNCWTTPPAFFPGLLNYCTEVPATFGPQPAFAEGDFKGHYDHYTIGASLQPYFGFRLNLFDGDGPQYFVCTCGGFGFNVWPYVANLHRYLAQCYTRRMGCESLGFFDDCFTGGRVRPPTDDGPRSHAELCAQFRVSVDIPAQILMAHECLFIHLTVMSRCGYFLAFDKQRWIPTFCAKWVGIILDARCSPPQFVTMPSKRAKLAALCNECLTSFSVDYYFYDRMAGFAQSISVSCPAMVVYSKFLYARVKSHRRTHEGFFSSRMVVGALEISFCRTFLALPDSSFSHPWFSISHDACTPVCHTVSDANDFRWSCALTHTPPVRHSLLPVTAESSYEDIVQAHEDHLPADLVASGEFPAWVIPMSIGFKELYAIVVGIQTIVFFYGLSVVYGRRIQPYLDNLGDVFILRKGGSTAVPLNMLMVTLFWMKVHWKFDISLPMWLSTTDNFVLDAYTRIPLHIDAHISDVLFEWLDLLWGPFTVDLMASDASNRCTMFFSRYPCPGAAAVDVFAQDLSPPMFGYAFPPTAVIPALLAHLRHCRARAVVLLPAGTFSWTPCIVGSLVQRVLVPAALVPFAFESSRNGPVPSNQYNCLPYCAVLLDFSTRPTR